MPYVSKEERERERRLTLPELVALIQAADGCSFDVACEQVRKALRDAAIWPLHWEPEPHPPPSRSLRIPGLPPPGRDDHWLNIKFDWERGRVFDDFERAAYPALRKLWREKEGLMIGSDDGYSSRARPPDPPKPRRSVWRMLFLDRPACEAIWPPKSEAADDDRPGGTSATKPLAIGEVAGDVPGASHVIEPSDKTAPTIHAHGVPKSDSSDVSGTNPRKPRSDATRPDIIRAIKKLRESADWEGTCDHKSRRLKIDNYLKKPRGWCKPRTYDRALRDLAQEDPH